MAETVLRIIATVLTITALVAAGAALWAQYQEFKENEWDGEVLYEDDD